MAFFIKVTPMRNGPPQPVLINIEDIRQMTPLLYGGCLLTFRSHVLTHAAWHESGNAVDELYVQESLTEVTAQFSVKLLSGEAVDFSLIGHKQWEQGEEGDDD